jgi:Protein of unknown function (DUF1176)
MRSLTLMLAAAATATAPTPQTGTLHSFGDWIVGCDNGRACQAVALMPDTMPDDSSTMVISRAADPAAPPVISMSAATTAIIRFSVDGILLPIRFTNGQETITIAPASAAVFVNGIVKGHELLASAPGKIQFRISLHGASAALRYMDEQQKRAGTVTALVARGNRPISAIPSPPALPVIAVPPNSKLSPMALSARKRAELNKADECEADKSADMEPSYGRLDAGHSVAIRNVRCENGAYNFLFDVYVIDAKGIVSDADFDAEPPTGFYNVSWNDDRLTTYYKGRGVGDCGERQSFAWDGKMFRLVEQDEMDRCGGSADYIPTWRARVVKR